jgi:hypothetical protein
MAASEKFHSDRECVQWSGNHCEVDFPNGSNRGIVELQTAPKLKH